MSRLKDITGQHEGSLSMQIIRISEAQKGKHSRNLRKKKRK
jgi:hypothetical protein